jgi:purine-binding chemotaxis protein CheW
MLDNEELLSVDEMMYDDDEDTLTDRYLTFNIGNQVYAIEIRNVTEIIGIQKVTKVPNIKSFIKGIINLRGIIVPIVDVRKRFNLPAVEYDEKTCIIVVNFNDVEIGLIVDEVAEVINIPVEDLSPPPETNKGSESKFIEAMAKINRQIIILLNLHRVLYEVDKDYTIE